jgi:hypothetical protein
MAVEHEVQVTLLPDSDVRLNQSRGVQFCLLATRVAVNQCGRPDHCRFFKRNGGRQMFPAAQTSVCKPKQEAPDSKSGAASCLSMSESYPFLNHMSARCIAVLDGSISKFSIFEFRNWREYAVTML